MWDQDGVHDIYRSWRRILDAYPHAPMLVAEAWVHPAERQARYVRPDEMHQAYNIDFLQAGWRAEALRMVIDDVLHQHHLVGASATWVLSNYDVVRHATRLAGPPVTRPPKGIGAGDPQPDAGLGLRRARAATLLMLALPGSAYLYQGEELGLPEHTTMPDDARQDPTWQRTGRLERGRDGCRVRLPWTVSGPSFGFGPSARSWLPRPAGWGAYAAQAQDGAGGSTLELYRAALRLRREHRLGAGPLTWQDDVAACDGGNGGDRDADDDGAVPGVLACWRSATATSSSCRTWPSRASGCRAASRCCWSAATLSQARRSRARCSRRTRRSGSAGGNPPRRKAPTQPDCRRAGRRART